MTADAIGKSLALGAAQAPDAYQFQPPMGTLASAAAAKMLAAETPAEVVL